MAARIKVRDPKIDPEPDDCVLGMNQCRIVLAVGNTKDIAWWAPKEGEPVVRYRLEDGLEGCDKDVCTLRVWRRWTVLEKLGQYSNGGKTRH